MREERKADLDRHVQEVNAILRGNIASTDDANLDPRAASDAEEVVSMRPESPLADHNAEYVDEEKYTSVTVEEMVVAGGLSSLPKETEAAVVTRRSDNEEDGSKTPQGASRLRLGERPGTKPRQKRKKFRYENKAERKFTRLKERSKNSKQAKARRAQ